MEEFTPKKIYLDNDMTKKLMSGVKFVADVVTRTMGADGQLVMYEDLTGNYPVTTKDGVSVASMIALEDKAENMGAQFVIQACRKQVSETGDGTTLTALLSYEFYKLGLELVKRNPFRKVVKEFQNFGDEVVAELKARSITIDSVDQLKQIARVSINGDADLADKIAEAVYQVGKYGIVSFDRSQDDENHVDYEEGYKLDTGIKYKEFITEGSKMSMSDPYFIVTDKRLVDPTHLNGILTAIQMNDKSKQVNLVIVSPSLGSDVLQIMVKNISEKTGLNMVHIRPCENLEPKKNRFVLEDVAAATGAKFIAEDSGYFIQNMTYEMLGRCKLIASTPTQTFLYGLADEPIKKRIEMLSGWSKDDEISQDYIKESMAKLTCGMAVIRVGGKNFTEQMEKMHRVDDAIHACKSAQEMGYVRGGGVELVMIGAKLDNLQYHTGHQFMSGITEILVKPMTKILDNSRASDKEVRRLIVAIARDGFKGFDIEHVSVIDDMYDVGIVDPVKVLAYAFKNAISVAISMLKTSAMITESK
jgi:chaperonin GroEL